MLSDYTSLCLDKLWCILLAGINTTTAIQLLSERGCTCNALFKETFVGGFIFPPLSSWLLDISLLPYHSLKSPFLCLHFYTAAHPFQFSCMVSFQAGYTSQLPHLGGFALGTPLANLPLLLSVSFSSFSLSPFELSCEFYQHHSRTSCKTEIPRGTSCDHFIFTLPLDLRGVFQGGGTGCVPRGSTGKNKWV